MDRQDGLVTERPAVLLLKHLAEVWPPGETFVPTVSLLKLLVSAHPDVWGAEGPLGKSLTAHRFGRMLAQSYLVNSTRPNSDGPRGYTSSGLSRAWGRMNLPLPKQAAEAAQAAEVAQSGPVQPVQPLQPVQPEGTGATGGTEGAYPKCEVCGHDLWAPQSQAAGICARCAQAKAAS